MVESGDETGEVTGYQLGHYHVHARIGVGGMGEVYRAYDNKLGREVAIKVLPSVAARNPDLLSRFRQEARLMATLNYPSIDAIYGLDAPDDFLQRRGQGQHLWLWR